jgi:hypothetical protein
MSRVVTGAYGDRAEAEQALAALARQVPLSGSAALDRKGDAAVLAGFGLGGEARDALARQIEGGSVLLLARVADEAAADRAIEILRALAAERAAAGAGPADGSPAAGEELRVGRPAIVGAGARISLRVAGQPARQEASLRGEGDGGGDRRAGRRLGEEELARGGLLIPRVLEFGETREVPVVEKRAVVREELVVRKFVEERTERIDETLRHTEVEVEELPAGRPVDRDPAERRASGERPAFGFDGGSREF